MTDPNFMFLEPDQFAGAIRQFEPAYGAAHPFPHAVIDDFLPLEIANRIADEFPDSSFSSYKQPDNAYQHKKLGRVQENDFRGLPGYTRHMLGEFNGKIFLDFLESLTGISGLIADPHFLGGALHQILPGGRLAVHADFNWDKRRSLDRRINVLIYFNRDWREEYGGHLELWDEKMSRCEARIAPLFNRCVIFNTTSTSFHGHPDPLACPPGRTRNSIALYYYTNSRPDAEKELPHDTVWKLRPGEVLSSAEDSSRWRRALRSVVPPIAFDLARPLWRIFKGPSVKHPPSSTN